MSTITTKQLHDFRKELVDIQSSIQSFIEKESDFKNLPENKNYLFRRLLGEIVYTRMTVDLLTALDNNFEYYSKQVFNTKGDEIVGGFEAFKYDVRPDVFEIKEAAKKLVNTIQKHAGDSRRTSLAYTNIETGQMYGVKALFTEK